jgi:hypothetical protein
LGGKEGEDARPGADVDDRRAGKVGRVLLNGGPVCAGADIVLQHVLLVLEHAIVWGEEGGKGGGWARAKNRPSATPRRS